MSRVMVDNISDRLDKNYRSYHEHHGKSPSQLRLTPEDLAELKEFIGLGFMDELLHYKGCKVIISERIKVSHYE